MRSQQREQNPDVNSYRPDIEPGEDPTTPNNPSDAVIPVPPDAGPTTPIEEPPSRDDAPVGDVDDSPKRIV